MRLLSILLFMFLSFYLSGVEKFTGKYGRDYFVELPENFNPEKKYWLFVLVHGHKGNGEKTIGKIKKYQFKDECITVAPSFPWDPKMGGYYQMLGGNSDKQLLDIFKTLGEKYKLHDRMLLWGHSGGAQFTHRFAMAHHKTVLACASSSGGSWGKAEKRASYIPFAISCGEKDTKKSVSSAPMGRLDWYRSFRQGMIKSNMFFIGKVRPGEGHGAGPWCTNITNDLFKLASTGVYPNQKESLDKEVGKIREIIKSGDSKSALLEISRLKSFRLPTLEYKEVPVDDTDEAQQKKFKKSVNEYGFTGSKGSEKYLKERFEYYLNETLIPELQKNLKK